jgi:glycosyltransferase involved in cell wall biosynthesis
MRYTIVTPTICRPSLARLCTSLDRQSSRDWEHLVVVDLPREELSSEQREILGSIPQGANRPVFFCDRRHKNYGHTCRHQVWDHVRGEYILYVDDDDYFADDEALKTLDSVTEQWAVFLVLRHGKKFLNLPPGRNNTGTGMFLHRKEIGRWPDSNLYEADGIFVEELAQKYPFRLLDSRPLVALPMSSCGVSNIETRTGSLIASARRNWIYYRKNPHLKLLQWLAPRIRGLFSRVSTKPTFNGD